MYQLKDEDGAPHRAAGGQGLRVTGERRREKKRAA
jgi:hypothetical protein